MSSAGMRLWFVNGISRKEGLGPVEISGIGMTWVASSEAEAIGLTHQQMAKDAPTETVAKLWAQDVTDWCRDATRALNSEAGR